jgi:succinyl-CoA synthetase beta subunit
MNLHEYQAKALFAKYGLPVPVGEAVSTAEEAVAAAKRLGGNRWIVKAQVHAGGRGKAGGVKLFSDLEELRNFARSLLGTHLVTYQTDSNGQLVSRVLVEAPSDIAKELYLGAVVDRASQRIIIMASTEGGVEIEKVASETPEKILRMEVNPLFGVLPYQGRDMAFQLGLQDKQIAQFTNIVMKMGQLFQDSDLSLVEINPLVITKSGDLICLDGKINVDDNALYRQKSISEYRDPTQEDVRENRAKEWEINYVALDGNIGCMVNGAGLAMATMDLIKLHGGNPANFLDVGGGATQERVTEAFKIILSDDKVKGVFVNIFGGIVRCDDIAMGIIAAVKEVGIKVPVIVRLEGNQATIALKILSESGLNIIAASSLTDGAKKAVEAAGVSK